MDVFYTLLKQNRFDAPHHGMKASETTHWGKMGHLLARLLAHVFTFLLARVKAADGPADILFYRDARTFTNEKRTNRFSPVNLQVRQPAVPGE